MGKTLAQQAKSVHLAPTTTRDVGNVDLHPRIQMKQSILIILVVVAVVGGLFAYLEYQANQSSAALDASKLRVAETSIALYISTQNFYGADDGNGTPNTISTFGYPNDNYCENAGDEPKIFAEIFVNSSLRAPSTSQFGNLLVMAGDEKCHYRVSGHVDSQNGFGAMIRTNFTFEMRFDPELGKWRDLDVTTY